MPFVSANQTVRFGYHAAFHTDISVFRIVLTASFYNFFITTAKAHSTHDHFLILRSIGLIFPYHKSSRIFISHLRIREGGLYTKPLCRTALFDCINFWFHTRSSFVATKYTNNFYNFRVFECVL